MLKNISNMQHLIYIDSGHNVIWFMVNRKSDSQSTGGTNRYVLAWCMMRARLQNGTEFAEAEMYNMWVYQRLYGELDILMPFNVLSGTFSETEDGVSKV